MRRRAEKEDGQGSQRESTLSLRASYFARDSCTFSFVIIAVGSTIVFGTFSPLKIFSATSIASLPPVG